MVAATVLSVPAANAGLIGSVVGTVTQALLPTCGASSQVFRGVDGDTSSYYAFSNNGLESGTTGWTLAGGAFVGIGNEPWFVNGPGFRSLTLLPGASATSPGFCINLLDPAVRMFAAGTYGGTLRIQVLFYGPTGNLTGFLNHETETGTGAWAPTNRVSSLLALPIGTAYARIKVTAVSGVWLVDDLFVDPSVGLVG
jgi:hypothetical protein